MRKLSAEVLREFGAMYRVDVNDEDLDHVEAFVGRTLDGFEQIDEILAGVATSGGERTWREPTESCSSTKASRRAPSPR